MAFLPDGSPIHVAIAKGIGDGIPVRSQVDEPTPVIFESTQGLPGTWRGIGFKVDTLDGSSLDNVIVRHGGQSSSFPGAVLVKTASDKVSITNSTFSDNEGFDIFLECGATPTLTDNTYDGTGVGLETGC